MSADPDPGFAPGSSPVTPAGLAWSVHPAAANPLRTIGVLVVLAAFLALVYLGMRSTFCVLLGGLLLFAALFPYFTRTSYVLDAEGVEIRTPLGAHRRAWSGFRTYRRGGNQILLCTRKHASRLDTYRGCRLFLAENEEEVLGRLRAAGLSEQPCIAAGRESR